MWLLIVTDYCRLLHVCDKPRYLYSVREKPPGYQLELILFTPWLYFDRRTLLTVLASIVTIEWISCYTSVLRVECSSAGTMTSSSHYEYSLEPEHMLSAAAGLYHSTLWVRCHTIRVPPRCSNMIPS